jgi:MazG family protein
MSEEQQIFPDKDAQSRHLARACSEDTSLGRSLALVRYLRSGCEWDAKQTPATLRPYLLEEAHEVAEAIRGGEDSELSDELGDLLLNIAFQIVLAEERGAFGAEAVVEGLERKMIERHPHLYGDAEEAPDWEELKAKLRKRGPIDRESKLESELSAPSDPFAGVPGGLEPLSRALRLQDRAAARGFDWPHVSGAMRKLREEIEELESELAPGSPRVADDASASRILDELGDVIFAAVNVARLAGAHPSVCLDRASEKFAQRFRALLQLADERGIDPDEADLATLDRLWDEVKLSRR